MTVVILSKTMSNLVPCVAAVRVCRKCGESRAADRFPKSGFVCKECINARERYRRNNPGCPTIFEERRAASEKMCRTCGEKKPVALFTKRSNECKACRSEYYAAWRTRNRDSVIAQQRSYYKANEAELKVKAAAKYQRNSESIKARAAKWYSQNKQRAREAALAYYQKHAHEFIERANRRRALVESVTVGDPKEIEKYYSFIRSQPRLKCYWCGRTTEKQDRHVDHIIPLHRGGAHSLANLCCSCKSCNLRKHTKLPEEITGQAELALI